MSRVEYVRVGTQFINDEGDQCTVVQIFFPLIKCDVEVYFSDEDRIEHRYVWYTRNEMKRMLKCRFMFIED